MFSSPWFLTGIISEFKQYVYKNNFAINYICTDLLHYQFTLINKDAIIRMLSLNICIGIIQLEML